MCEMCGHDKARTYRVVNKGKWYKEVRLCEPCADALATNGDLSIAAADDGTTGVTFPGERGMSL